MSKHTAGPWRYIEGIRGEFVVLSGTHPDLSIGVAVTMGEEANANLIAAAPELLESLTALVTLFAPLAGDSTQTLWIDNARAAITKAKGEQV
ncbi:hypothetical protein ICN48_05520 [Polynucleobacter sp. JS-Safj-400b-B2]|uniref:hypothetical protein n=1 Tax=Polynucleobacter sp. JS-Safj-400b-B2 TaxID=2576921 RepID=UPI001C0AA077|nr:hypothetical protein [Polynucleobacter sp. JS-Safj-400b-B2]MBU3625693.1 hypothetical protein [Polynucleobacter sp. JS-Safj-400b-B2]